MANKEQEAFMQLSPAERKDVVMREIWVGWTRSPDLSYFGNWDASLLGGKFREVCQGQMHISLRQVLDGRDVGQHSPRFLEQTPGQFFQTIDLACKENGIFLFEIREAQAEIRKYSGAPDNPHYRASLYRLQSLSMPVFEDLRVMGYTHADLTEAFITDAPVG